MVALGGGAVSYERCTPVALGWRGPAMEWRGRVSGDTTPCKVTPVILHGVVSLE